MTKASLKTPTFWDNAEIFETVIDAYEVTRDEKYLFYIKEISDATLGAYGKKWTWNEYNDDIMWLCIAYSRAYLLTGEADYLRYAKINFDSVWQRAYSEDLGGGLWWRTDNQTKNSVRLRAGCNSSLSFGQSHRQRGVLRQSQTGTPTGRSKTSTKPVWAKFTTQSTLKAT